MDDEKVITLKRSVKLGDETIGELRLREPTAGEFERATTKEGLSMMIDLIAMVSGRPRSVIEKIGARDMREAAKFIGGFIEDGPITGSIS